MTGSFDAAIAAGGGPQIDQVAADITYTHAQVDFRICDGPGGEIDEERVRLAGTSEGDPSLTGDVEVTLHVLNEIETGEIEFAFDGEGGVERAWVQSEPHAHALVEELMILATEAVGALLAGRRREALFRVHERPEPQSIELLLAKLAALEVPTPPASERLSPDEAARLAARVSEPCS